MYSLIKTLVRPNTAGAPYQEIDGSPVLVRDLFQLYDQVYLVVSHPAVPQQQYVDLSVLRTEWFAWTGTLGEKLVDNANRTLPTTASVPRVGLRYARFSDAWQAGYKTDLCDMGIVHPAGYPKSSLRDLKITRTKPETDMALVHQYCLPTVNGYIHDSDTDGQALYVIRGGESNNHSQVNMVGLWSFHDVGAIQRVRLTNDMIRSAPDSTLADRVYFDVPGVQLEGKSYLLVLGGYVVWADGHTFHRNGERQFALDLKSIPYEARLHESSRYIRLDNLKLDRLASDPDTFTVESMWSDEAIRSYLTLSQTFLVVINTPNLMVKREAIRTCGLAGQIISYTPPRHPVMVGYGKFAEYHTLHQEGQYVLMIEDGWYRHYQFKSVPDHLRHNSFNAIDHRRVVRMSDAAYYVVAGFD